MTFWYPLYQRHCIYNVTDIYLTCFWLANSAVLKDDVCTGRNHRFSQFLVKWIKKERLEWLHPFSRLNTSWTLIYTILYMSIKLRVDCQFKFRTRQRDGCLKCPLACLLWWWRVVLIYLRYNIQLRHLPFLRKRYLRGFAAESPRRSTHDIGWVAALSKP